tara:strand:- start:822 stop:1490 length:669 start_codon:yes stop_codon:yes gene_type:complete
MKKKSQKSIFLKSEGNSWYKRNKHDLGKSKMVENDFFIPFINDKNRILEIGCSNGNNLNYVNSKLPDFNLEMHGVDPSREAINSGNKMYPDINLQVGTSETLDYDDRCFDIVICGNFLYLVDRDLIFRTISEIDRVLKYGGFLIIVDFDVPAAYSNNYIHCENVQSYKNDYSKFFVGCGHYTIVGKKQFSIKNRYSFHKNIDERISSTILYKELIKDVYKIK